MRIEPPSAERRVTRETVTLHMTADARLEALTRRLAVTDQEEPVGVVESRPEHAVGDKPRLRVAGRAEGADVVTVAARRFARVRRRGMPAQEARRMVSRPCRRDWAVAIEAFSADVAPGAARPRGGGGRSVAVGEARAVRRGSAARRDRCRARIGSESSDRARRRGARVTLVAELPRVTSRAARGDGSSRNSPMAVRADEPRIGVRRRHREGSHVVTGEPHRLGERQVTPRARGVGGRKVGRANRVTRQAPFRGDRSHRQPRCARVRGAGPAGGGPHPRRGGVTDVVEAQVAASRRLRGSPRNHCLDRPIVAGGARCGRGPERHTRLRGAYMARRARGEERAVLRVVESRTLRDQRRSSRERAHGQRDHDASGHRAARPPGMRRTAGGRPPSSSPRPNETMARSVRRH